MHKEKLLVRSASSLLFDVTKGFIFGWNYLTRQEFECTPETVSFLSQIIDWTEISEVSKLLHLEDANGVYGVLTPLLSCGAIVEKGSPEDKQDHEFRTGWKWKSGADIFHFGSRESQLPAIDVREFFRVKLQNEQQTEFFVSGSSSRPSIELPDPTSNDQIYQVMYKRRSRRAFSLTSVPISAVSDCLFAGAGITSFIEDPLLGKLPLKVAPSGGARNPFDLYLFARNVSGLEKELYRYLPVKHALERSGLEKQFSISAVLADQQWADDAAAIVLLVANFDRSMWKYEHSSAYRCVLIEAGHIAQNILLMATARELKAVPTAAIIDNLAKNFLNLNNITQALLYAVALGWPGSNAAEDQFLLSMNDRFSPP